MGLTESTELGVGHPTMLRTNPYMLRGYHHTEYSCGSPVVPTFLSHNYIRDASHPKGARTLRFKVLNGIAKC